jgi:hypothetical protein
VVESKVDEFDQQVRRQHAEAGEQKDSLQERVVPATDGLRREEAETGDAEDALDNEGAAEDRTIRERTAGGW